MDKASTLYLCHDSKPLVVHLPQGIGVNPPIVLRHGDIDLVIVSRNTKTGPVIVKICSLDVSKTSQSSIKYIEPFLGKDEAWIGATRID